MNIHQARHEARQCLGQFVGSDDLGTETLNAIENVTNGLISCWSGQGFLVVDEYARIVSGIKLWYDLHTGALRAEYRY